MSLAVVLITLVLLAAVVALIGSPLRARSDAQRQTAGEAASKRREQSEGLARDQLEAAREAKYREIRDAELDYRTGKLSEQDYAAVDAALRAEANEILHRLDQVSARDGPQRGQATV